MSLTKFVAIFISYAALFVIGEKYGKYFFLGEHAIVTSSDLPTRMQGLTTKDQTPSTSSDAQPGPSSSKS